MRGPVIGTKPSGGKRALRRPPAIRRSSWHAGGRRPRTPAGNKVRAACIACGNGRVKVTPDDPALPHNGSGRSGTRQPGGRGLRCSPLRPDTGVFETVLA